MSLHNPHIVAEPGGNSVNVDAFTRANRRKRVTHHMWANPGNALDLHILTKCAPEVEPVTMASVRDIGLQYERRAQTLTL